MKTNIFSKKAIVFGFFFFLLIISALAVYYLFFQGKDEGWQTYTNSRYEFSVDYPLSWALGEQETNNAGREMRSPKGSEICYAYGFENALVNEQGEQQTLQEFIDWLYNNSPDTKVLEQKQTSFCGQQGIEILSESKGVIKIAVYALGKETGRGLFCTFQSMAEKNKFSDKFHAMAESFKTKASLNGEETINEQR